MKKIFLIIVLLICVLGFKVIFERVELNDAKQVTEIVAMEKLGEDCMLITQGVYLGSAPYKKGFWFGFIDKEKLNATIYTAVPTLDGKNWFVREHISQSGGDYQLFFAKFR